jgi:hypothetical protein
MSRSHRSIKTNGRGIWPNESPQLGLRGRTEPARYFVLSSATLSTSVSLHRGPSVAQDDLGKRQASRIEAGRFSRMEAGRFHKRKAFRFTTAPGDAPESGQPGMARHSYTGGERIYSQACADGC